LFKSYLIRRERRKFHLIPRKRIKNQHRKVSSESLITGALEAGDEGLDKQSSQQREREMPCSRSLTEKYTISAQADRPQRWRKTLQLSACRLIGREKELLNIESYKSAGIRWPHGEKNKESIFSGHSWEERLEGR